MLPVQAVVVLSFRTTIICDHALYHMSFLVNMRGSFLPGLGSYTGRRESEEGRIFVTDWRLRESLSAARLGVNPDGYCCSEDRPVVLARHPLQQAGAQPVECPASQSRRLDRGPRSPDSYTCPDPDTQRQHRSCRRRR